MSMPLELRQQISISIAMKFFQAKQPLAAAIVFTDMASEGSQDPQVWCGLGSCLMNCRGLLVQKPFEQWAGQVFTRGNQWILGSPYEETAREWLQKLKEIGYESFLPIEDHKFPSLLQFLLINNQILPDAVAALPEEEYMTAVMALGDRQKEFYIPVLVHAILGKFGAEAGRSALKRIKPFTHHPEIQKALQFAAQDSIAAEYGPYLTFAMNEAFSSDSSGPPILPSTLSTPPTSSKRPWWKFW